MCAGQEVKVAGLSTHHINSSRIPEVLQRLASMDSRTSDAAAIDGVLRSFEVRSVWLCMTSAGKMPPESLWICVM